ncbi:MAG TPA: hypothetical protein VEW06_06260 [Xanthobacteraceae bacterium]|nr:hypothetical protein [Xanthobacteraceae bacterium]
MNAVERTEQYGVDPLVELVEMALDAGEPKPWNVFPEGKPCRTPDKYLRYAAGVDCVSVGKLIAAYKGEDDPLVRKLRRCTAEAEKAIADENQKAGVNLSYDVTKVVGRGNSSDYLLRRLAREHPDILEAYVRGDHKTPTAAARAAGINVDTLPLTKLRRAWKNATQEEREMFLAEIVP